MRGIYAGFGGYAQRSGRGFQVFRQDHWALEGTGLSYADVATKLKCRLRRKAKLSVRSGETEPGAAVRRLSDRSADGPGV